MGEQVNSGLLRIARQRHGLAQGEAARRLGVPQVSLSRYENAVSLPGAELVARAAEIYRFPKSFFYQPDQVIGAPVSVHPMWRKKSDVTVRELDKIVSEINIRAMHLRRMLDVVDYNPQSNIPKLDPEEYDGDIERIASIVRAHWLLPRGVLQNLTAAVEKAGAIVIHSSLGGSAVSGVTIVVPGLLPIILLNRDQPGDRLRFTLAHELGHLVMHRFPTPSMETEANDFASALLMPKDEVSIALRSKLDLRRLAALKPEWRVSMQALLYRAQKLGLIPKEKADWLWRQFAMHRMRLREPPEYDFPIEKASVVTRMVRLHLDTLGYDVADLAQILHVEEAELHDFYDLQERTAVPGMKLRLVR